MGGAPKASNKLRSTAKEITLIGPDKKNEKPSSKEPQKKHAASQM